MSDSTTPLPGAASDPVTGVSDAVAAVAGAVTQHEQNLKAESDRLNTAAMQANALAQEAQAQHAEFVQMQQDAAKGDAKAQDWIRRAVSAAGLICALFCALMLPACDSPKTVVPVHGPIPPVADYSDDGRQDGGIWQFNADGSQVVTQGVKDNYARLLKKFLPSQDAARGFTAAGNAPNGCPLWHMDADICGLYGDLCGDERDRITPTN